MTSLDMAGLSLTLMALPSDPSARAAVLKAVDAPVGAAGWAHTSPAQVGAVQVVPVLVGPGVWRVSGH